MSFLHTVRVGFFGTTTESQGERDLDLDECLRLLTDFVRSAPADLQIQVTTSPQGSMTRGYVIGYASGYPILLKTGMLICPYLSTSFILGSIAFAAFVQLSLGCSIYSDDEGTFFSLQEFIPSTSFAEVMREVARMLQTAEPSPGSPPCGGP
jgi:hypothetical protein